MNSTGEKSDLFVCNGKPLQFNIKGCQEHEEIKQLIELFGGVIANKQQDGVIQLLSPVKGEEYNNAISYKFIYSCVNENKLLPVDEFIVNGNDLSSDSDNFSEDGEEESEDDEEDLELDNNQSGINTVFKREHDEAIVNFILKNNLHKRILSQDTYNKMVKVPILSKINPQVLRQHFFDNILPVITDFEVTDADIKNFLNIGNPEILVNDSQPLDDTQPLDASCSVKVKEEARSEIMEIEEAEMPEQVDPCVPSRPNISGQRKSSPDSIESQSNPLNSPAAKSLIEDMRLNLFNKATQQKLVGESSQAFDKMNSPISRQDCLELIHYISNHNCFQDLKSDHTWRNIQRQQKLKKNTASILRRTFETIILPNILSFVGDVSSKRLKPFLIYAAKECILPPDQVKYNICQVLNECSESSCKYPHSRNKPTLTVEFTKTEDTAILNFIVKKNCFSDLKLMEVWQEMSKQEELRRHSVLSLRTRFKILLDMIKNEDEKIAYLLEDEKSYLFRACYDQITEEINALEEAEKEKDFTRAEDYAIIGFIMEKRCIKDLDSNELWREMQKHVDLKHHTADALRKRFEKYLLPNVEVFTHCIPRKFFNAFVEYRFKKNYPRILKIGDSDTLVKMCLPEKTAELEYDSKNPTGRVIPTRARRAKGSPPAKTPTNRSESLKIFNLKKSLGAKLTSPPQFTAIHLASTASVDSFDSQLLKDIVPGIKAMQDRFRRAARESPSSTSSSLTLDLNTSSQSSPSRNISEPIKRLSRNSLENSIPPKIPRINEIPKSVSTYLTRRSVQMASSSTSETKRDKEISGRVALLDEESGEAPSSSTSVKSKAKKTTTKENLNDGKKKSLPKRGKLTIASENLTTADATNNPKSRYASHIELLNIAKKGVFDVEDQITKWCGDSSGGLVQLKVDDLKDMCKNLKNIQASLYKAVTASKVELIMKGDPLSLTEQDHFEIHKYLTLFK